MFVKKLLISILVLCFLMGGCKSFEKPLPHSIYFLKGSDEESQVWRLERDGRTLNQITSESKGVENFAVSSVDGTIALVSDNKLFLQDSNGKNRRLIADGSLVKAEGEDSFFRTMLTSPFFSPDGQTLAYGLDGIHLYDLATGRDDHVLTDLGNLNNESFVYAKEVYSPGPWSPDGSMLLIDMSYYEGFTLAVMKQGVERSFLRLRSEGAVCCMVSWTPDSRVILVANPYFTGTIPGLWRFDSQTGEQEYLIPGRSEDGLIHFVGWPYQTSDGGLTFFYAAQERFDAEKGIPLKLVYAEKDGSNIQPRLEDEFRIRSAFWAPDGSLVIVAGSCCGKENQLLLVHPDAGTVETLMEEGGQIRYLAWGP